MYKWLWIGLWASISPAYAQTQLELDILYLQQQVSRLRQTVLEQDSHIAQQNAAIQQLRGELELLEHQVRRIKNQPRVMPSMAASGHLSSSNTTPAKNVSTDKKAYQTIYAILEAGNDEQAINEFQEFLLLYPNSQYADDAQFWLAEAYYSKQDFISALVAYEQLIERYQQTHKRAQAELKIAYCYFELKDVAQAKSLLNHIKQKYAQKAVARLATKKLAEIESE